MWAEQMRQGLDYLQTGGPFPRRLHLIALNGRFILSYLTFLRTWARWAEEEVQQWADVAPLSDGDAVEHFRAVSTSGTCRS